MMEPQEHAPPAGLATAVAKGVARVLAPNPSPMTHWGTNTYLVGENRLMVLDPGPAIPAHEAALQAAIAGRPVCHVIVTHAHLDHSAMAPALARSLNAPTVAFGPASAGRSAIMRGLAASGLTDGGEGLDPDFVPDLEVTEGDTVSNAETTLHVRHTPGHLGSHICLAFGDVLFTGDHLMAWAPSLVSPPDGDLTDFMVSCARLRDAAHPSQRALPGHGAPIRDVAARLDALIAHRQHREAQIREALRQSPGTARELAARIYTDIQPALLPAAARNVLAHLVDLTTRNIAHPLGEITADTCFEFGGNFPPPTAKIP